MFILEGLVIRNKEMHISKTKLPGPEYTDFLVILKNIDEKLIYFAFVVIYV